MLTLLFCLRKEGTKISNHDGLKKFSLEEIKLLLQAGEQVFNSTDFSRMNLDGVDFSGCSMVHCSFEQASCNKTRFSGANLTGSDFTFGCLQAADFSGAILTEACFLSANLSSACFSDSISYDTDFSRESAKTILSHCSFKNARLNGADFSGASCTNADFSGADIKNVCFSHCDMSFSILYSAIYDDSTDFQNCNMHGCRDTIGKFDFRSTELEQMRERAREISQMKNNTKIPLEKENEIKGGRKNGVLD